jgi:hypothetical protein
MVQDLKASSEARDGFVSEQWKGFTGKQFTISTNITNSGQTQARAGGKFNSVNSHKFNGPVRNGEDPGNFSYNGGNNYYGPSRPASHPNNLSHDEFKQNRPNLVGLKKNSKGKYNSVVVKKAMTEINNNPNKKVRQYAKDLQSVLCVENLADKYANTGNLEELQHGLNKLHHQPKAQHQQKSRGSNISDKTSSDRVQEVNYSSTSKGTNHDANMAQMYQGCLVCSNMSFTWMANLVV